ncbi:MAG: transcription antitermination factor NusB [Beijerinckiaceae bacterium]
MSDDAPEKRKRKRHPGPPVGLGERRSAARLAAVQALYQMDLTQKGLNDIIPEFERFWLGKEIEGDLYKPADGALFRVVVQGVLDHQRKLDPLIDTALSDGWPLKRVETIMRAVLRAGAYELLMTPDTPVKVVISEYVDIARAFFEREETNMVNAVLDKLAREARGNELAARSS